MRESSARKLIMTALAAARLDPVAIENGEAGPGTPDVECLAGWVEVKVLPGWPARGATVVRVPHFRPEQRLWLRRRWRAGGLAWVVLRVAGEAARAGADWHLLEGPWAADHLGVDAVRADIEAASWWSSGPAFDGAGLAQCLVRAAQVSAWVHRLRSEGP